VFEVDRTAQLLAEPGRRPAPASVADSFVPGLEMVHAVRQEHGERTRDHDMVEGAQ
jgi:hypothetical protein